MKKSCITLALTISLLTAFAAHAEEKRSFIFDFASCDYGLADLEHQDKTVIETNVINKDVPCHVKYLDYASFSNSSKFNGDGVVTVTIDRIQGSGFTYVDNKSYPGIRFYHNADDTSVSAWNYKITFDVKEGYELTKVNFISSGTVAVSIYGKPDYRYSGSNISYTKVHSSNGTVYFEDPTHVETLYEIGRSTPRLTKLTVEYTKIDQDAPDSFEDSEQRIAWNIPGLSGNSISEEFNFKYDPTTGVAPHSLFLPLVALDAQGNAVDSDFSDISFYVTNALTGTEITEDFVKLVKMEKGVSLSISQPGHFRIAIKNNADGLADYKLPEPLQVNILPADINFAELNPDALSFTHSVTSYDAQSKTHPAGEYSKLLENAFFFNNEAHSDALELSMVPNGWQPANVWDGIVPEDTPVYLTREEFENQYNIDNHHRIYIEPTAELTCNSLSFKASHAGKYLLTASVKDDFKTYFADYLQSKTYEIIITPDLNNNSVSIMACVQTESGEEVETPLAMPDPDKEDSWGMVKNEEWSKNARLHTIYAGDIYYRIEEKKGSDDFSTPYRDAMLAQQDASNAAGFTETAEDNQTESHPKDGFTKYEPETGIDLSNASQLILYTVSNGLTSNEKMITFDGADLTAVEEIETEISNDMKVGENEWYTISGMRISKPQTEGIYICRRGGKIRKVMIKY